MNMIRFNTTEQHIYTLYKQLGTQDTKLREI